jgi:hypothetical protein
MSETEYIHPSFVEDGIPSFDFMLLKLTQQSSNEYIKLNENPDIPTGQRIDEVTAVGFGTVSRSLEEYPTILQRVELTYINNDECDNAKDPSYADNYRGLISDAMLCAGDFGQDTCRGDSGGPLIVDGGSPDKDILVGIVSWCVLLAIIYAIAFCIVALLINVSVHENAGALVVLFQPFQVILKECSCLLAIITMESHHIVSRLQVFIPELVMKWNGSSKTFVIFLITLQ